ncbi:gamma carbonic anhydrase family protein [Pelagibius sp. Alg239-R121]|uniref:gamma carbonic anhydrase family protein n=1 Tax=Pelagibius sp. Alg239-R121 TaxID=2993448 RepID=UPI0024A745DE|nr:gamma carbonic anhydrase family protein [Pelagibius sp. Alg239-R121]
MSTILRAHRGIMPKIHETAFIAETAVIIGDVEIGPGSSVWYGCVIRGDVNAIRIGADTNIQDGSVIHVTHDRNGDYRQTGGGVSTTIGDGVTIGHMALLHACEIESHAFIGMRAVLMDKAVVETGAMVAAGAMVTPGKRVLSGQLWSGAPAAYMRDVKPDEAEFISYLGGNYADLAASYRDQA